MLDWKLDYAPCNFHTTWSKISFVSLNSFDQSQADTRLINLQDEKLTWLEKTRKNQDFSGETLLDNLRQEISGPPLAGIPFDRKTL